MRAFSKNIGMWLCAIVIIATMGAFIGCGGGGGDTGRSSFSGGGGTSSPTPSGPPEVTGINPASPRAGDVCTITGKSFGTFDAATCDVTFGGVSAKTGKGYGLVGVIERGITSWADTEIVVTVPENVPASGNVVVKTAQGSSSSSGGGFTTERFWRGAKTHTDASFTGAPGAHKILVDPRDSNKNDFLYVCVNGTGLFSKRYNGVTGTWGNAKRIDTADANPASSPDFAIASNGNAICVFIENGQLKASLYDPATDSWNGTLVRLDTTGTNVATPKILFHNGTEAWVVWVENDAQPTAQNGIFTRMYDHNQAWGAGAFGTTGRLDWNSGTAGRHSEFPAIAFKSDGTSGFCVFDKFTNVGVVRTFYSRYAGGAWTAATGVGNALDTAEDASNGYPTIAMDANGNALAVFYNIPGFGDVFANWFSATNGTWSGPTRIDGGGASLQEFNPVAFDSQGNAIVVFNQDSNGFKLYVNRRTAGDTGSWSGASLIDINTINVGVLDQSLMFDPAGTRASVVYTSFESAGKAREYANRYTATTNTWNGPEVIDNGTASPNYQKAITAMDKEFNIFGKWIDTTNVHYNFFH